MKNNYEWKINEYERIEMKYEKIRKDFLCSDTETHKNVSLN